VRALESARVWSCQAATPREILPLAMSRRLGWSKLVWPDLARRYVKFCLVGASGMAVDMVCLYLLSSPSRLGWNLALSKALAAEAALLHNFVWNEVWTFRGLGASPAGRGANEQEAGHRGRWRRRLARLIKFNLVCLAGIGWSVLLLYLQVHGLGWNVYLSNFIAIVLVSFWNFGLNLKWGWGWRAAAASKSSSGAAVGAESSNAVGSPNRPEAEQP
jgi:dolichol-phosphate mannosyltransferase